MTPTESYDCVIIGGGPAGATVATLLADHGHRALLLEKSTFPRHHIGESLVPHTYFSFKRLGLLDKLRASGFPSKESVQFVSASGKDSQPFYFTDRDPGEWSTTWQVTRDQFDRMMLDNARDHGAEIRQGVRVERVLFDGSRAVGVQAGGEIRAKVVVDASGQSAMLSRQIKTYRPDPDLKNGSIYAYFKGALRDEGRNSGATLIINTPTHNGWFWFIPLEDDIASVGVVAPPTHLFTARGNDPSATLDEEIAACPGIARRLASATRMCDARVTRDFSYRSRCLSGDGWVLVGDAFGFLDPVYSSGVMLAMKTGEFAADAIHDALASDDASARRLGAFGEGLATGMQYIRQLIYAFYDRDFNFGAFLREYPQHRDELVRVLIGDVFDGGLEEMFQTMKRYVDFPEPVDLEDASAVCGECP